MIVCGADETRIQGISISKSYKDEQNEDMTVARFKVARPLTLETMMALEEGAALRALHELSKARVDSQGSNTVKVQIKRDIPELVYSVHKGGKLVASVVGRIVNSATVAIVEGNASLVFSFEAKVSSKLFAKLATCVKRDDTELQIEENVDESKAAPKGEAA